MVTRIAPLASLAVHWLDKRNENSTAVDLRRRRRGTVQNRGNNRCDANRQAAQRLFAAWERWDLETVESLVADGAIDRRPQSDERFVGHANIMAMYREVPGPPRIEWRSVRGGPTVWVGQGIVEYGEGPVHLVGIVEFTDGKLTTADYYFADRFEPPASRARWATRPASAEAGEARLGQVRIERRPNRLPA